MCDKTPLTHIKIVSTLNPLTDLGPLFSYKDIRQQNQRLYSLLPEARAPGAKKHQVAVLRTNRLLASLYSQVRINGPDASVRQSLIKGVRVF